MASIYFWEKSGNSESKKHAFTFDTKLTTAGGQRYTAIDLESTRLNNGSEVTYGDLAYEEQLSTYFRCDVKFGVRLNSSKRNIFHWFFIDFQNITNRENEFIERYNEVTDEINLVTQNGFFPDVLYRVTF